MFTEFLAVQTDRVGRGLDDRAAALNQVIRAWFWDSLMLKNPVEARRVIRSGDVLQLQHPIGEAQRIG